MGSSSFEYKNYTIIIDVYVPSGQVYLMNDNIYICRPDMVSEVKKHIDELSFTDDFNVAFDDWLSTDG